MANSNLLCVDIGNTNVTLGLYEGKSLGPCWRLATKPEQTADEYALKLLGLLDQAEIDPEKVTGVSMASVVPPLTGRWVEVCQKYLHLEPLVVDAGVRTGVKVRYDDPRAVGADRIVDAVAASKRAGEHTS